MNFLEILTHTLPVFLMVGVGYLTRQLGVITEEAEKSIVRLVVNVLYPCFILTKIPGNESLQQLSVVFIALSAGFLLTLTGLFLSRLVGVGFKIEKKKWAEHFFSFDCAPKLRLHSNSVNCGSFSRRRGPNLRRAIRTQSRA